MLSFAQVQLSLLRVGLGELLAACGAAVVLGPFGDRCPWWMEVVHLGGEEATIGLAKAGRLVLGFAMSSVRYRGGCRNDCWLWPG